MDAKLEGLTIVESEETGTFHALESVLSREIRIFRQQIMTKDLYITNLESQLSTARAELEKRQAEVKQAKEQYNRNLTEFTAEGIGLETELSRAKQERDELRTRCETLEAEHAVATEKCRYLEVELAAVIKQQAQDKEIWMKKLQQTEDTFRKEAAQDRESFTRKLQQTEETFRKESAQLICKTAEAERSAAFQAAEIENLRTVSTRQIESLSFEVTELRQELEARREEYFNLRVEAERAKATAAALEKELLSGEKEDDVRRHRFEAQAEEVRSLRTRLHERETALVKLESELVQKTAEAEASAATIIRDRETFATEKAGFEQQISELKNALESSELERNVMKQILQSTSARSEMENRQLHELMDQLGKREKHLQAYAASLSNEKAEIARQANRLANEVRAAQTLHPLKDYLTLTEREITRLEVQLKKTPTSSSDRLHLEACITQMTEQRTFLKSVIANSEEALNKQASALSAMSNERGLAPVPPLPPFAAASGI